MDKQANVIQDVKDNVNYAWYVTKHKANIVKPMLDMGLPVGMALKHDLSKYSPAEFPRYRDWFVGPKGLHGTQDPALYTEWRKAVEHHYTDPNNLHHWAKIDPEHPEKYPINNRMEAVADWYSVGKTNRTTKNFPDFKTWYKEREPNLKVDPMTKMEISRRLGLTKAGGFKNVSMSSLSKLKGRYTAEMHMKVQGAKLFAQQSAKAPGPVMSAERIMQNIPAIWRKAK